MKLMVGLGNPGAKYAANRHNVGFMAVDAIAAAHGFGPWRSRFRGVAAEGRLAAHKVLLLKPETFMNLSGEAVQAAMQFHKLPPAEVVVFHDELDLAPGACRLKTGGGHGGHNGLRSISAQIGPGFTRVRIGIGHPGDKRLVTPHVLGDFTGSDAGWRDAVLGGVADGAPALAEGDGAGFQSALARRRAPEAASPADPPPPAPEPADTRSALHRLIDRFR